MTINEVIDKNERSFILISYYYYNHIVQKETISYF